MHDLRNKVKFEHKFYAKCAQTLFPDTEITKFDLREIILYNTQQKGKSITLP